MGINAYSVTGVSGQETLTNIATTGINLFFNLTTGHLNVTSINADAGTVSLLTAVGNITLGSTA